MLGRTIAQYRILEEIGRGGMGVVYKAYDTRLRRQVAIKMLPEHLLNDPDRKAHFAREARILATLNFPGVAAIHDYDEWNGRPFLVLEMVEGKTLAEKLERGRLPLLEAIDICSQIAEGLEAAHACGVIHRDLKPSNVKLTPEGKVKILDFGLAKALAQESVTSEASETTRDESQWSAPGIVVGSPPYMSPEQASGRPVDRRTDVWALGCILFECLAGKAPFRGDSITEILAAVMRGEPDWSLLPPNTPESLQTLLRRCLEKNPDLRMHDIADVRIEMQDPPAHIRPFPSPSWTSRRVAAGIFAIVVISILLGIMMARYLRESPTIPPVVSMLEVAPGYCLPWELTAMRLPTRTALAIAGDGRYVVYEGVPVRSGASEKPRLFRRWMNRAAAEPISGTEGGTAPFLSPDGHWIGFWAESRLMKVSVDGGLPQTIGKLDRPLGPSHWGASWGASWGRDGTIVFAPYEGRGLYRIPSSGGDIVRLTSPEPSWKEFSHRLPFWLPNSKGLLFTIMRFSRDLNPQVALLELETGKWHVLLDDAADARYVPTGHVVFVRRGILMAIPFDIEVLEATGPAVPVLSDVMQALNAPASFDNSTSAQFSISESGSLVYVSGGVFPEASLSLVTADLGDPERRVRHLTGPLYSFRLSPDGRTIAAVRGGLTPDIEIFDPGRGITTLLHEGMSYYTAWTPDGKQLTYELMQPGGNHLVIQPVDKSSGPIPLVEGLSCPHPGSWSPDGEVLAFVEHKPEDPKTNFDILLLRPGDPAAVTPFLDSEHNEAHPEFSLDGRWLAYTSDESGRYEVYVRSFPDQALWRQISVEGGSAPVWSRSGTELYFQTEGKLWVAGVRTSPTLESTRPRVILEAKDALIGFPIRALDIWPESRSVLLELVHEVEFNPITKMVLIQNWFEELRRLCPAEPKR